MYRRFFPLLAVLVLFALAISASADEATPLRKGGGADGPRVRAMVIPVRDAIDDPILYIIRRGLKTAIDEKYDVVVLDMNTPGGSLATTFEILEALEKYPGQTITYVNKEALSAGAFISAMTKDIYFAPGGVIGAAAPVSSSGTDIDKTMKQKVVSYLKARVRALSEGKGAYRADVISSMVDEDFELKIGERVIKKKGELLSLTATEASEKFGEPPQPLLASGIAGSVDELLDARYGKNNYGATRLEVTWSEDLAVFLNSIKPVLMGLGLLGLFIEFKLQGSGVFGAAGLALLALVFLSSFVAGLSGHEPILFFVLGAVLLAVELFFFPGVVVMGVAGVVLMAASLLWAMADLWPQEPISVAWDANVFLRPVLDLGMGLAVGVVGAVLALRFLPRAWLWDRMVLAASVSGNAQTDTGDAQASRDALIGSSGRAITDLFPSGTVEVDGRRYEGRMRVGTAKAGDRLRVHARSGFGLVLDREES